MNEHSRTATNTTNHNTSLGRS